MTFVRILFIILIFSAIGISVVYLRRCSWNYAHKTNLLYDEYRKVKLEYIRNRIELAHRKSPQHILKNLKSLPIDKDIPANRLSE